MNEFHAQARRAVRDAFDREGEPGPKGRKVAEFYGIPVQVVYACLREDYDVGSVNARRIMRVELARMEAVKRGERNFVPAAKDRYKGTRSI